MLITVQEAATAHPFISLATYILCDMECSSTVFLQFLEFIDWLHLRSVMYSWWAGKWAFKQLDGINISEEIREIIKTRVPSKEFFSWKLPWLLPWKHEKGFVCLAERRKWLLLHNTWSCVWMSRRRQSNRRSRLPSPSLPLPPLPYTLILSIKNFQPKTPISFW